MKEGKVRQKGGGEEAEDMYRVLPWSGDWKEGFVSVAVSMYSAYRMKRLHSGCLAESWRSPCPCVTEEKRRRGGFRHRRKGQLERVRIKHRRERVAYGVHWDSMMCQTVRADLL